MDGVEKIRAWLSECGYDGVLLGRRDNFSFVTKGAQNHVLSSTETGIAHYLITQDTIDLIADSSDLSRMSEEQDTLKATPVLVPWYKSMESFLEEYINGKTVVSDTGIAHTTLVKDQLVALRMKLSSAEVETYRTIGRQCAQIVEGVCIEAEKGNSEQYIANQVKKRCIDQGISPDCVLVGADERILNYRHPMPTDKKIANSLMVVLGGEKYGLNVSMTRMVYFDHIPEEIQQKYEKVSHIFASMQHIMKEGLSYSDFFGQVCHLYEEAGYEQEWKKHHQGGPTGYGCRELIASPDILECMHTEQVYAWNPTISGTKCEETTYLGEKGVEVFTRTVTWPCKIVDTSYGSFEVADILLK